MGSMIAQIMAATFPERLVSQCLMMTTSGAPSLPRPSVEVMRVSAARPADPSDLPALQEWYFRYMRTLEGAGHRESDADLRANIAALLARAYRPAGTARQTAAVLAAGDRTPLLGLIDVPTLVIHGDQDPLTRLECGQDVARKIPGARIEIMKGMGHLLPTALLGRVAEMIDAHARAAQHAPQAAL